VSGIGIEIGRKLRKGSEFSELRQIYSQRTSDAFYGLCLR
jgi:hypothetical protein